MIVLKLAGMKLVSILQPSTETSQTRIHGKSQSLAQCLSRASEAHQRKVSDKVGSATGSLDTEHRHAILRTLVHHLDQVSPPAGKDHHRHQWGKVVVVIVAVVHSAKPTQRNEKP